MQTSPTCVFQIGRGIKNEYMNETFGASLPLCFVGIGDELHLGASVHKQYSGVACVGLQVVGAEVHTMQHGAAIRRLKIEQLRGMVL